MPVAVISGGTKGIGRAVADLFVENGFDLCIGARNESDLESMKLEYRQKYPEREIFVFQVDVSIKSQVMDFAAAIKKACSRVDVLVNNAGFFQPGLVISEDDGVLESIIETNLYSAYYLTRALIDEMIKQKSGHIFNMCSVASFMAYPNGGSYSISKFALLGFSKSLREEVKSHGIKVSSIMPGATWSDSWKGVDLPDERLMKSSDVAKAIFMAYTLSDSAVMEEIILRPQLGDL